MSIIFEALKKTQTLSQHTQKVRPAKRRFGLPVSADKLIASLIAELLVALFIVEYGQYHAAPKPIKTQPLSSIMQKQLEKGHILSGVFVSNHEKIALIDNKFFNLGDTLDGMMIVKMEFDHVVLKAPQGVVTLRV